MSYAETLDYLFTRLPMYSRIGAAAYKDNLDNTIALCNSLHNPQRHFKSIHVAGTNGKGSVSHILSAIFQQAGYKTGLYTSPHLKDFRERIKINGAMIDESYVVEFTKRLQPLIEELEPSFFEITVAMAFEYFKTAGVDIAIIETGLGGRLDSTNVIQPELSIITNIGYDHMNLLGDSLEKIAAEKAGIIKENTAVVIGEWLPETRPVFEKFAKEKNASLHFASLQRQVMNWQWQKHELVVEVAEQHKVDHTIYHLDLAGLYQRQNLLTVLEATSLMQKAGWEIEATLPDALRHVKKLTGLHGRWDVIHEHPMVVLDVAHNEAGMRQVLEQVEVTDHHDLHIILGVANDKDINAVLQLLPVTANYYFTKAQIPRALDPDVLMNAAAAYQLKGHCFPNVNSALQSCLARARKEDLVIVCGSVFLVGEVDLI